MKTHIDVSKPELSNRAVVERACIFSHPDDVVADATLSVAEKRALLARWLSDANALTFAPALRQAESGAIVSVDAIMQALKALDHNARSDDGRPNFWRRKRGNGRRLRLGRGLPSHRKDDDDPPPAPAAAPVPRHNPPSLAGTMIAGDALAAAA